MADLFSGDTRFTAGELVTYLTADITDFEQKMLLAVNSLYSLKTLASITGISVGETLDKATRGSAQNLQKNIASRLHPISQGALVAADILGLRNLTWVVWRGGIAGALALVSKKAVEVTNEMIKLGYANERVFRSFYKIWGSEAPRALEAMRRASHGMISDLEMIRMANYAAFLGVADTAEELAGLMDVAIKRGYAMGIDAETAFNRIVTGIGRLSARILDDLGILTNARETYEAYAASIGKSADELTDAEKRQALVDRVLRDGARDLEINVAQTEALSTAWANLRNEFVVTAKAVSENVRIYGFLAEKIDGVTAALRRLNQMRAENRKFFEEINKLSVEAGGGGSERIQRAQREVAERWEQEALRRQRLYPYPSAALEMLPASGGGKSEEFAREASLKLQVWWFSFLGEVAAIFDNESLAEVSRAAIAANTATLEVLKKGFNITAEEYASRAEEASAKMAARVIEAAAKMVDPIEEYAKTLGWLTDEVIAAVNEQRRKLGLAALLAEEAPEPWEINLLRLAELHSPQRYYQRHVEPYMTVNGEPVGYTTYTGPLDSPLWFYGESGYGLDYDRNVPLALERFQRSIKNTSSSLSDLSDEADAFANKLHGLIEQQFRLTQVTREDLLSTWLGVYRDKPDEYIRRLRSAVTDPLTEWRHYLEGREGAEAELYLMQQERAFETGRWSRLGPYFDREAAINAIVQNVLEELAAERERESIIAEIMSHPALMGVPRSQLEKTLGAVAPFEMMGMDTGEQFLAGWKSTDVGKAVTDTFREQIEAQAEQWEMTGSMAVTWFAQGLRDGITEEAVGILLDALVPRLSEVLLGNRRP